MGIAPRRFFDGLYGRLEYWRLKHLSSHLCPTVPEEVESKKRWSRMA